MTKGVILSALLTATMAAYQFTTFQDTSYFVAYYKSERGASGTLYGLISIGHAIGSIASCIFLNALYKPVFVGRLAFHSPSYRTTLIGCLSFVFLWAVAMSLTTYIADSTVLVGVIFSLKVCFGFVHFIFVSSSVNCIEAWLPGKVYLVNSLVVGVGHTMGQSAAAYLGSLVYVRWGFEASYWVCAEFILLMMVLCFYVLPEKDNHIFIPLETESAGTLSEADVETVVDLPKITNDKKKLLSPLLILPALSLLIIQAVPGFTFISLIPYLRECCSLHLTHAASYLFFFYLVTGAGYFVSGMIAQTKLMRLHTQSLIGAFLCTIALATTYPSPSLELWYTHSKFLAYFTLFLICFGDPMLTANNKKHMEEMQVRLTGTPVTTSQKELLGSIWTAILGTGYHVGGFIGAMLQSTFSYHVSSWIMTSLVFMVVLIMIGLLMLDRQCNKKRLFHTSRCS